MPLARRAREDGTAARPVARRVEQRAELRTDDLGGARAPGRRPGRRRSQQSPIRRSAGSITSPIATEGAWSVSAWSTARSIRAGSSAATASTISSHEVADSDRRRLEARPPEQASGLADAESLVQARLQPLDAQDVVLRVAPVRPGRPLRLQHAVALLPLAERRGGDAGLPRDGLDVHAAVPRSAACRNFPPDDAVARVVHMAATRDDVLEALRAVIDPELHRSVVELDMVREVEIEGSRATVTLALTIAGCPLRSSFEEQVERALEPLDGPGRGLALLHGHDARGEAGADDEAPRRRRRAHAGDLGRREHARDRGCERQGRRRQVVALGQPRRGLLDARQADGDPRRGRLRLLDPAHARHQPAADRGGQDDRPAGPGRRRPEGDVDRVLPRGQRAGHVARPDAPPRARAVPLGRPLGRARRARRGHAARAPATWRSRSASCCRGPRRSS